MKCPICGTNEIYLNGSIPARLRVFEWDGDKPARTEEEQVGGFEQYEYMQYYCPDCATDFDSDGTTY